MSEDDDLEMVGELESTTRRNSPNDQPVDIVRKEKIFSSKLELKNFVGILSSFKMRKSGFEEVVFILSKRGVGLYCTDRVFEVSTHLPISFFQRFKYTEDEETRFKVQIKSLIEYLEVYDKLDSSPSKIISVEYPHDDGKLSFKLTQKEFQTEINVGVFELDEMDDSVEGNEDFFEFGKSRIINSLGINSEALKEMLTEVYWMDKHFYLCMDAEEPHLTISSKPSFGNYECSITGTDSLNNINCKKHMRCVYLKRYLENIIKALKVSEECSLKMNKDGVIRFICSFSFDGCKVNLNFTSKHYVEEEEEDEGEDDDDDEDMRD